jgi:hypothetical protein
VATSFPNDLDSLMNPNGNDPLSNPSHSDQHINANDAIEALQVKVGVDNSTDPSSLDYMVRQATTQTETAGSAGNNSANEVPLIENPTALDEVDGSLYGTIKYLLQLTYQNQYYVSEITVFDSSTGIDYVESNIISNTMNDLATIAFSKNGSIISLVVTPENASVTARYYRTSLKK